VLLTPAEDQSLALQHTGAINFYRVPRVS